MILANSMLGTMISNFAVGFYCGLKQLSDALLDCLPSNQIQQVNKHGCHKCKLSDSVVMFVEFMAQTIAAAICFTLYMVSRQKLT